jgi:rhodanese-related sulfurtransferase
MTGRGDRHLALDRLVGLAAISRHDLPIILMCREGYASSLAAATLQDLGLMNATDLVGGFAAWVAAGLPVSRGARRV